MIPSCDPVPSRNKLSQIYKALYYEVNMLANAHDQAARKLGSMAVISRRVSRQQAQAAEQSTTTMLQVSVDGVYFKLRVDSWLPTGGEKQWGLLLEPISTKLSKADTQLALATFCNGKPLVVLSTRFEEP